VLGRRHSALDPGENRPSKALIRAGSQPDRTEVRTSIRRRRWRKKMDATTRILARLSTTAAPVQEDDMVDDG
jgi:hypothetical protein